MYSEELLETMYKLYDNLENIKQMDNSFIIVQHKNNTMSLDKETFLNLVNNEESIQLANRLDKLGSNDYIIVAYDEGCIIGNVTKII